MKITFLGGADEVGASGILVETAGRRVLVDCGIRPSPKAHAGLDSDQLPDLSQLESGSGKLDAVLVTHAHTDHTGALELVLERYPDIPVYATAPTLALTRVLHHDSRRIMQSRLDEEGELPLFDDVAVQRLLAAMAPVPFRSPLAIADGLTATYFPAGHIAGAAMIGLESGEGRLLISGDISISAQRTVDGAKPPAFHPDVFIVESTYGGRLHANRAVQERKIVETIAEVTAAGGKVLIPAFALGRAQEILLILSEYQRRGELPAIPVWADGMVRAVCQAYPTFGDALPLALQEQGAQFFRGNIRPVASNDQRNAIIWDAGPAVIVASSGMLAGGPSLSYARALASKPEHAILLTGYQDEESPGRRLQKLGERGSGSIRLGAHTVDVRCQVATYSLSAHADESQIINLTEALNPDRVYLVHGDLNARLSLEKALNARQRSVHLPRAGQTFELEYTSVSRLIKPDHAADLKQRQAEINRQRREQMRLFAEAPGKWMLIKGEESTPGLCLSVESDHLWIEFTPGLPQPVFPEAVLVVLGSQPPTSEDLAPYAPPSRQPSLMEPNQALAAANAHFPPQARLRRTGYRLADHVLTLSFDFPDAALQEYAGPIAALGQITGWKVEVTPETNQSALNALVREVIPSDWQITKGPAIHRDQKRVAVTISSPSPGLSETEQASQRFLATSGWQLAITETISAINVAPLSAPQPGKRMEINAAYAFIKSSLEGSSLYRTSLKGEEIVLSFISPQVARRYQSEIADLAQQTGWQLSVNPQPNQGAILEIARALLFKAQLAISKGPGIYPEKAAVIVTLSAPGAEDVGRQVSAEFTQQTGYELQIDSPPPQAAQPNRAPTPDFIEIPLAQIRLSSYQQSLQLDPVKLDKAIERARRTGISPPIEVRRGRDVYLLMDGVYRLRAAEALGLERIPAVVR